MRILMLCEGDPETNDSWSGVSKSLLRVLRAAGHEVRTGDVDLYGPHRLFAAGMSLAAGRKRWAAKYHFGRGAFELRSRNAARHIREARGTIDVILQFGATFEPRGHGSIPYALYCDSNIAWTERGQASVRTDIAPLTARELRGIRSREDRIYKGAAHIFTMSTCVGMSFHETFGIAPDRITPVHAGPNCDVTRIPGRLAARGPHAPTILFIGRQFERKGGGLLLRAFERVRSEIADAELLIVGPSEMPDPPPGVTCLGFINKDRPGGWEAISAAYERADVFCLPTKFEPFGIVFVEAMHFGVPCLGPNAWAVPEIIVDGETGFTFPPDDEAELAARLVTMLGDPNLAYSMGMASRDRARERFTWEAVGAKMDHALTSLLGLQAAHV